MEGFVIVRSVLKGLEIAIRDTVDQSESVHRFRKLPVRIGRNELNDLHIDKGFVSQFHAVIEDIDGQIVLRDLGSTNGSIVDGEKLSGSSTTLGQETGVFAILTLLIRVRKITVSNIAPRTPSKKAMNVTGLLKAPPADLLNALIQAGSRPPIPEESAKIEGLYSKYRQSWNELRAAMQEAAMSRPAEERGAFFTSLSSKYPGITSEPDFHRMADAAGTRSLVMRDPQAEAAIALEGLKEIFSEYVAGENPPESPDDLVKFLTRIRAVLDVFFKAFLPLRDGQRQFEQELGIHGASKIHPVETVDKPSRLSAILLSLRQAEEDSVSVVEATLADIMIHHVAMLNGVMRGVRNLLAEISPSAVRSYADQLIARGTLSKGFLGADKALWQAFERKHADLVGEEKQLFALLFGLQFSQAYQEAAIPGQASRKTVPPAE